MRILIIEDDERIWRFMKRGLEGEQYEVDIALNGQMGLDLLKTHVYNMIILDVYLPGQNGLEICKQLRDQEVLTPILMMTARDSPEMREEGFRSGANDYLPKPFPFEALLAKIRKWSCLLAPLPPCEGI